MELVIDDLFKRMYKEYYDELREHDILQKINDVIHKHEPEIIIDILNLVKTSSVMGLTYAKCRKKITKTIIKRFPIDEDIDLLIISIALKFLISSESENVEQFLFRPRDIHKEVAAKYYRVSYKNVTDEMTKEVMAASDRFTKQSYSIDDPPVESWDEYFYNVCRQIARNSKCLSRRIGAVLVWDKGIISTGYNGAPRGIPRCDIRWNIDLEFANKYKDKIKDKETSGVCPRHVIGFESGQGLEICPAGHAERNALINAARKGIQTKGTILYMSCGIPCTPCLVEIINAGVKDIVVTSLRVYDETAMYLLQQGKLNVRLFDFVK